MSDLWLYGTGGHAREMLALVHTDERGSASFRVLGWIEDDVRRVGTTLKGLPVQDLASVLEPATETQIAICVGDPRVRSTIAMRTDGHGVRSPLLIHPRAWIGRDVELGAGTQVAAGAMISTDVRVGRHVIVNQGATIAHDVVLGDFATVAPGAHLSGAVQVGEGADIGTGASLIQGIHVGPWSRLGAGSAIIDDVPAGATVVGVPGRIVRRDHGDSERSR